MKGNVYTFYIFFYSIPIIFKERFTVCRQVVRGEGYIMSAPLKSQITLGRSPVLASQSINKPINLYFV